LVYNIWYQSSFLGQRREAILVIFAELFLRKKGVAHFRLRYETFCSEFSEINWIFGFLSEKYPISKKKSAETESGK
jgi:hypothetical protein